MTHQSHQNAVEFPAPSEANLVPDRVMAFCTQAGIPVPSAVEQYMRRPYSGVYDTLDQDTPGEVVQYLLREIMDRCEGKQTLTTPFRATNTTLYEYVRLPEKVGNLALPKALEIAAIRLRYSDHERRYMDYAFYLIQSDGRITLLQRRPHKKGFEVVTDQATIDGVLACYRESLADAMFKPRNLAQYSVNAYRFIRESLSEPQPDFAI